MIIHVSPQRLIARARAAVRSAAPILCRVLGVAVAACSAPLASAAESAPASLADCVAPVSSRVIDAAAGSALKGLPAQAAWLDARTIRVGQDLGGQDLGGRELSGRSVQRWVLLRGAALDRSTAIGTGVGSDGFRGGVPNADGTRLSLHIVEGPALQALQQRPQWRMTSALGVGRVLSVDPEQAMSDSQLKALHREPLALAGLDSLGRITVMTRVQSALALDALYAPSAESQPLGVEVSHHDARGSRDAIREEARQTRNTRHTQHTQHSPHTRWALWAPTARSVSVCVHYAGGSTALQEAVRDGDSGIWRAQADADLRGRAYTYLVEVWVPDLGWVRNRVTDPYSVSLTADSGRSAVISLDDPALMPRGWRGHRRPAAPRSSVDMMITELHVRDFSASDESVPAAHRGRYRAFEHLRSRGMRHLTEQAKAGLTDVHLLPIFDLATVPERGCVVPDVRQLRAASPDGPHQQARVQANAAKDCFNWGYDPFHFNAPEGSYATDAQDPAVRIREMRAMIMALHGIGLRVGMDVVYNHMSASGQHPHSVLDRIVPGYYHRLDARGQVERSTCCDNTATEHRMMRKLMIDSAVLWARHHAIDSFRFDLMGHQPREAMEALQQAVDQAAGRRIPLIGEGWNFGEVADGARFVQASQQSLAGSGIGTFNDRLRDAARGTRHGDDPATTVARKGWLNGWAGRAELAAQPAEIAYLAEQADLVRAGLAGSLKGVRLMRHNGLEVDLKDLPYAGQGAGYGSEPTEVVNYVENHDNPTLFDLNAFKLPLSIGAMERAQIQVLGSALVALAQGVAYWHAGQEILRSKSMDLNSFDSGDWFNRLDWTYADNGFGAGLPPGQDSRPFWPVIGPRLAASHIKPTPEVIDFSRRAHLDLLRLRASTPLLRLRSAQAVQEQLRFPNAGPGQDPALIVVHIQARPGDDSPHRAVLLAFNASDQDAHAVLPALSGQGFDLHPVHRSAAAADRRIARQSSWTADTGALKVPSRSAVVYVLH